jgi:deoxycytidine triphosphate deaminase
MLADWQIEHLCKAGMITPWYPLEKKPGRISNGISSMGYDVTLDYKFFVPKNTYLNNAVINPKAPREDQEANYEKIDLSPLGHTWKRVRSNLRQGALWKCQLCHKEHAGKNLIMLNMTELCPVANKNQPTSIVIPPRSFVLGQSVETFNIPRDLCVVVVGKSTYARCAIDVNVTPGEPEWNGKWTIEITNNNVMPVEVFCGEGIIQCLFFRSDGVYQMMMARIIDWIKNAEETVVGLSKSDHGWSEELRELRRIMNGQSIDGTCRVSYKDKKGKYQDQQGITLPKADEETKP